MSSMLGSSVMNKGASSGRSGMKAPSGYKKFQQYTPEQMDLFQQMFSNVGPDSYLAKLAGGDQSMFEEMEAPAMRQFAGLQGNMASRFSGGGGAGSLGSRRSSGFQNEMTAAGSNFAQDLQSQRQGLQRQAIQDLMGMSNSLLGQKPYGLVEKQKPWWQNALTGAASGFASGFGESMGGKFSDKFMG